MSTTLFVFKTHQINVTNLVQYHIVNHCPEKFYKNCSYYADRKFLCSTPQTGVKEILSATNNTSVRNLNWAPYINLLASFVEEAEHQSQYVVLGNHNIDQLTALKKYFGSAMTLVCINYGKNLYHYLLNNMAQYHVYLLSHGLLVPTDVDREILAHNSAPVEHYQREFERLKMIPESSIDSGDYTISVDEFFDEARMEQHFAALGFPNQGPGLYHQWLQAVRHDNDIPNYSGNIASSELA